MRSQQSAAKTHALAVVFDMRDSLLDEHQLLHHKPTHQRLLPGEPLLLGGARWPPVSAVDGLEISSVAWRHPGGNSTLAVKAFEGGERGAGEDLQEFVERHTSDAMWVGRRPQASRAAPVDNCSDTSTKRRFIHRNRRWASFCAAPR